MSFEKDFADYCNRHGVPERVELMLCDINGIMRGKWLPGDNIDKLIKGQVRLPLSTYAPNILGEEVEASGLGIVAGDPDGILVPIEGSLTPMPWAEGNAAQVLVEMVDQDGATLPTSPRQVLANIGARFGALGWSPVIASELEFYICEARQNPMDAPNPPPRSPAAQNYDLEVLDRMAKVLRKIQEVSGQLKLPIDTLIAEYGPGQFEINFHHTDDILAAADTASMFKRVVRAVVASEGMEATFMAKPYADHPGNGMHLHASVLDQDGANIFDADKGIHPRLENAVAGSLAVMPDFQAIFAPHLNSYRRFQPKSFAPSAPDWGIDHRGAGVRLPETTGSAARMEHRICGADVNPYLAFAAILGGMLYGLENAPDLPLPLDHPDAKPAKGMTHDWVTAVSNFEQSAVAKDLLGETYHHIYTQVRKDEIEQITTVISPIEYQTYLSRL